MKRILQRTVKSLVRAYRRRARVHALARLDARTLRDIGLEPWQGELGARIWAQRTGTF